MTPEAEFLLRTLQDTGVSAPKSLDWQALLSFAETHGVLPIFCKNHSGVLPEQFAAPARCQWTLSAWLATELQGVLEQFGLHGIEVLPLKGPLLAESLYGSVSLRPCDDLDLLVQPQDFVRAQSLLTDLGFVAVSEADDYHQTWMRGATCVELHFAVAPPSSPSMDLSGAWKRGHSVSFRGASARFFSKPDLLIYLTLHGIKHDFARLIWVIDAARVITEMNDEEQHQVLGMARAFGVEGALLTTCVLAGYSMGRALPPVFATAIDRRPQVSAQAQVMWQNIMAGPAVPQTSHQGAGTFVQLEPDVRRRWAQRLRLFLPSQQDRIWAHEHKINTRWMLVLRPFRLLSKHGPAAVWSTLFPRFADKTSAGLQ
jgi:hypothetical protein